MNISPIDIERIDRTSMRILTEIGIRVDDEVLRGLAIKGGAKTGRANDVLLLPTEMVREKVAMAPREAPFADREATSGRWRAGPSRRSGPGPRSIALSGASAMR